jgi:hypothetical protein
MTLPNYAAEGRVREACAIAGVLPSAIENFVDEFRAHVFDETDMAKHIEATRTTKPQGWTIAGTEHDALFIEAFGGPTPNLSKQGEVVKLLGESRAAEVAAQFGTKLGTNKPGVIPERLKSAANGHDKNPFVGLRDPRTGQIVPEKMKKVESFLKACGAAKTAALARAVGLRLDGTPIDPNYL